MKRKYLESISIVLCCLFFAFQTGCKSSTGTGTTGDLVKETILDAHDLIQNEGTSYAVESMEQGDEMLTEVEPVEVAEFEHIETIEQPETLYEPDEREADSVTEELQDDGVALDAEPEGDGVGGDEVTQLPWDISLQVCGPSFESCGPPKGYLRKNAYLRVTGEGPGVLELPCLVSLSVNGNRVQECTSFPCDGTVSFEREVKHAAVEATATCRGEQKKAYATLPVFIPWVEGTRPCIRWGQWRETAVHVGQGDLDSPGRIATFQVVPDTPPHVFAITYAQELYHIFTNGWASEKISDREFLPFPFSVVRQSTGAFSLFVYPRDRSLYPYLKGLELYGSGSTWTEKLLWVQGDYCQLDKCPKNSAVVDDDGTIEVLAHISGIRADCYDLVPEELYPFCDIGTHVEIWNIPFFLRVRIDPEGVVTYSGPFYPANMDLYFGVGLVNMSGPGVLGVYRGMTDFEFIEIRREEVVFVPACESRCNPHDCPEDWQSCYGMGASRVFALPDKSGVGAVSVQVVESPQFPSPSEPGVTYYQRLIYYPGRAPSVELLPIHLLAKEHLGPGDFYEELDEMLGNDVNRAVMDGLGRNHFVLRWLPESSDDHDGPWLIYISEYGTGDPTDWKLEVLEKTQYTIAPSIMSDEQGTIYVFANIIDEEPIGWKLVMFKRSCIEWFEPLEQTPEQ